MPTPSRTGTAVQIDASGAGSGSGSHTVPGDCNLVVAHWHHYDSNGLTSLSTLTLNGVGFTFLAQVVEGSPTDTAGCGVAILPSPATGSQTVEWAWSAGGARSEGGKIILVFYKDANVSDPYRAAGVDHQITSTNCEVTISSQPTDIISASCQVFSGATPVLDGTIFIDDVTLNVHTYDASDVTPSGGASTTVTMTGESYASMAAVSLKESVATGGLAWLRA